MDETQLKRAMELISIAGTARSKAIHAMQLADQEKFDEADAILKEAHSDFTQAHNVQTKWMTAEMNGEQVEKSILLIHSQDHFTAADILMTVATQYVVQAKKIQKLEAKIDDK